jgi:large subunit ribosomal protein L3
MPGIYGTKGGMWNFTKSDSLIAVTSIIPAWCWTSQIKTCDTDGYDAIQVSYRTSPLRTSSSELTAEGCGEFRSTNASSYKLNEPPVTINDFAVGEKIRIVGKSIGKGFMGNQKRHNYKRGPLTHGSKKS